MSKPKYVLIASNANCKDGKFYTRYAPPAKFVVFCLLLILIVIPVLYSKSVHKFGNILNQPDDVVEVIKSVNNNFGPTMYESTQRPQKYFIETSECLIPYVDPFNAKVLTIFNPKNYKYVDCAKDESFITSTYSLNTKQYFLHMNMPAIERAVKGQNASIENFYCCYREIVRAGRGAAADNQYKLLPCTIFHQDFTVPQHIDYIITNCYISSKKWQEDAFSFVQPRHLTQANNSTLSRNTTMAILSRLEIRKPNVLLFGIDSVSRINLRRTMPQTFQYLKMNRWFELQGYNKIGDNTFPNLMALLTSYNPTVAYKVCQPTTVGGLNKPICNLIWNNFKEYGYKTAYAEDSWSISTFNYLKKGFLQTPTDYYLRPFMGAIRNTMKVTSKNHLAYCVGRKQYGEYIFDYALQYANALIGVPLFGLFWMNSFSHSGSDVTATMDVKVLEYLKRLRSNGILERSIVLFFSDHGIRFGPLLKLESAFLEERLPMMFVSVPSWYQNEHPNFVEALQTNQKRLTSPYDIYATLKHILELTDPEKRFPFVNATTKGISIFQEVPENRTCKDAGIIEHWCACNAYRIVPNTDSIGRNVTYSVLAKINEYINNKSLSSKCSTLTLKVLEKVELKVNDLPNQSTYRISFQTYPEEAMFQTTTLYNKISRTITVNVEDISRLNTYAKTSSCIDVKEAKKYCICTKHAPVKM